MTKAIFDVIIYKKIQNSKGINMTNQNNQSTSDAKSPELIEYEKCFKFYEKAIEGRNFHYKNYNTWANYYAIFNGALFIGYYTIMNDCKRCNNVTVNDITFISFLIVLIGLITSICWNLTVKGALSLDDFLD